MRRLNLLAAMTAAVALTAPAVAQEMRSPKGGDVPATFTPVRDSFAYVKREVMIPMRDGVKLHTVIVVPRGATHAPIMLDRTPYSASKLTARGGGGPLLEMR